MVRLNPFSFLLHLPLFCILSCSLPLKSLATAADPVEKLDAVSIELKDGKTLKGQVFDLRRGVLEVRHHLGSSHVAKANVVRWTFFPGSADPPQSIVVVKDGRLVAGKVEFVKERGEWVMDLPLGAARYPLDQVERVVDFMGRGDDGSFMPRRGFEEMLRGVLKRIRESPDALRGDAVKELESIGYFAIPAVEESLKHEGDVDGILQRFVHHERTCAMVPAIVEEETPGFLADILSRDPEKVVPAVKDAVVAHGEELYPLLAQLVLDDEQPAAARSFALDYLQRMNRVAELIQIYQGSHGQAQFAVAVALGDLGLYVGVPTLLEVLRMDNAEARKLAADKLYEYTGENHPFDPATNSGENLTAIAKWNDWFLLNKAKIENDASYALSPEVENPARARATRFWREALIKWQAGDLTLAEQLLRKSMEEDPTCVQPLVCSGIICLQGRGRYQEALTWFERAVSRPTTKRDEAALVLAHYHMGRLFSIAENYDRASNSYRKAIEMDPTFGDAWYEYGDVTYRDALHDLQASTEDRKLKLDQAAGIWESGYMRMNGYRKGLVLMGRDEVLSGDEIPFSRREYNRSVNNVKDYLRKLEGRFAYRIAQARLSLNQCDKALEWADKSVATDDHKRDYLLMRAQILSKLDRQEEAAAARAQADALPPEAEEAAPKN